MTAVHLSKSQKRRFDRLAAQVGRITDTDRKFFERFPHRRHRVRIASQAEIEQSEILGCDMTIAPDRQHYVVVRNVAARMRLRQSIVGPRGADTDLAEEHAQAVFEMVSTDKSRSIEAMMRRAALGDAAP